jgi:signal transduction histidine kinase
MPWKNTKAAISIQATVTATRVAHRWPIARRLIELGDAAPPAAVGRTAYRIAEEGLTNARKHAPGAAVTLTVRAPDGDLQVEVRSLAPVAVGSGSPLPGAGTGLIGLAERVTLAGGELEHGVDLDGAFVLRARLPR